MGIKICNIVAVRFFWYYRLFPQIFIFLLSDSLECTTHIPPPLLKILPTHFMDILIHSVLRKGPLRKHLYTFPRNMGNWNQNTGCPEIQVAIHSKKHACCHTWIHSYIQSYMNSFIHSILHELIHSFIY